MRGGYSSTSSGLRRLKQKLHSRIFLNLEIKHHKLTSVVMIYQTLHIKWINLGLVVTPFCHSTSEWQRFLYMLYIHGCRMRMVLDLCMRLYTTSATREWHLISMHALVSIGVDGYQGSLGRGEMMIWPSSPSLSSVSLVRVTLRTGYFAYRYEFMGTEVP